MDLNPYDWSNYSIIYDIINHNNCNIHFSSILHVWQKVTIDSILSFTLKEYLNVLYMHKKWIIHTEEHINT